MLLKIVLLFCAEKRDECQTTNICFSSFSEFYILFFIRSFNDTQFLLKMLWGKLLFFIARHIHFRLVGIYFQQNV